MLRFIDLGLNRLSMYRLTTMSLSVLWLIAVALMIIGAIPYSPLALLTSTIVYVGTTLLFSYLFGAVFGVLIHGESSYITGMILALIFTPTLELHGLLVAGLTALFAAGSKFLLTYKGRHVFNPAAAGSVLIGIAGLAYNSWWIASPITLIPIIILGGLILYKTRRFDVVLFFIFITAVIAATNAAAKGAPLDQIATLILSGPLFYFAGFMLTEPLTLPRRQWQIYTEFVIVAVLFAVPFSILGYSTNPAFALVVGNLIAFVFSMRRSITLKLAENNNITPTVRQFSFKPVHPVQFEPGQYLEFTLPHTSADFRGIRRVFSITSAPEMNSVDFGIKFYEPSSSFKSSLAALKPGEIIRGTSINGDFVMPKDTKIPLLLIAGGIGITPFISFLQHENHTNSKRPIHLLYAINSAEELAYKDIIEQSGVAATILLSDNSNIKSVPKNWRIYKNTRLNENVLQDVSLDFSKTAAYVSGPPPMVRAAKTLLKKYDVKSIKSDYFTGY